MRKPRRNRAKTTPQTVSDIGLNILAAIINVAHRARKWLLNTVAGNILTVIVMAVLILTVANKAIDAYYNPSLSSGWVVEKSYSDGHTWSSSWMFGDYEFIHWHRNEGEKFYLRIQSGNFLDWWEVSEEVWDSANEGDYLRR